MKTPNVLAILVAALVTACGSDGAFSQQHGVPTPGKEYDWKDVARKRGLEDKAIRQIERDKFVVTNEAFTQVFTAYITEDLPLLVTTDSILNGYHVLFEKSVCRAERACARHLPAILSLIGKKLAGVDNAFPGDAKLAAAAKRRATLVIAVAMRLLGDGSLKLDADSEALVAGEVKRMESGAGRDKPAWLGPPDRGFMALDYTRYRPRGFYTESPQLQRYFRSVSWLQSIPFRVENDEEFVAILMLGRTMIGRRLRSRPGEELSLGDFLRIHSALIGCGDDWDLADAAFEAQGSHPTNGQRDRRPPEVSARESC